MAVQHIVDNRTFLLGLDELYRAAMKGHERNELLSCARKVARALDVGPLDVPVEGYYAEGPELTAYFKLMRSLQTLKIDREKDVVQLKEFQRLLAVASAPIYGTPIREDRLLPKGRDPLSAALKEEAENEREWKLGPLVSLAASKARASDDFSLVGLAAFAEDPVVMTALRESVVLYAEDITVGMIPEPPEYLWRVDAELARRAGRFVAAFNTLFGEQLPAPAAENAATYWGAAKENYVVGRCVKVGQLLETGPFYHWAVRHARDGNLAVHEFWHAEIWTTERYRRGDASEDSPNPLYVPKWKYLME